MIADSVHATVDGILTYSELLGVGYSPAEIRRARRSGDLVPLVRGSYASGQDFQALSPQVRHLYRARSRALDSPSVVLSHLSAAVFHGLPVPVDAMDVVHVTRPGRGGSRRRPGFQQHAAVLAAEDIITPGRFRVTSMARTVVDLSRTRSFEDAVLAADAAFRTQARLLDERPGALGRARHLPGAGAARRALAFADGRAESPGESRTRLVWQRAALPTPVLQCEVFDDRGSFVGRADLAVPECAVLVEFDGLVKYGDLLRGTLTPQQVLVKEKRREDALRELGWLVLRVTWADLTDVARFDARARHALTRGRRVVGQGGLVGTFRVPPPLRLPSVTPAAVP